MRQYFTEDNNKKQDFLNLLSSSKKIVITTHLNPDGDALGSSLGLADVLTKLGHQVSVIPPTDYPDFLRWLPLQEYITVFEGNEREKATELIAAAEVIFCLDFSVLNRIKEMENDVRKSTAVKVLVDHHQQPEDFADFVFWNEQAAATCELIYIMLEQTLGTNALSAEGATCLYAGLVTDTGSFRFAATTPDVHRVAGELIAKGVNNSLVHRKLFDTNAVDRLRFLGYALSQKLTYLPDYRVAYFSFTKDELAQFKSKNGDTEGVVNYGLSIAGVVMSAIFVERDDLVKISFRSVDNFSVSNFARDNFDGGGHHNAAGGRSYQTLEKTVDKFLKLLPTHKADLLAQP